MKLQRRQYVRALAALGVTTVTGCLDAGDSSPTVLAEPDREIDASELPYLTWGEQVPDVTIQAPLEDRSVSLRDVEKPMLFTFFYSHCETVCPGLVATLRNVQTHSLNEGYADEIELCPVTFDPARDTESRLREYGELMNVDVDAGNWHFLRPKTETRARKIVGDEFGVGFSKQTPEDMDKYMFMHSPITTLANGRGYVERTYRTKTPDSEQIIEHLRKIREA